MAVLMLTVLTASFLSVNAYIPVEPVAFRNTIFGEEILEGGAFEFVRTADDIPVYDYSNNPYRLPSSTRPRHYTVQWTVNVPDLSFSGEVDIELYATEANVNEIVVHAFDMEIESLVLLQGDTVINRTFSLQPEYHFLRVQLIGGSLEYDPENQILYTLRIAYAAPLRTDMTGLYRNWFRNQATDAESWMASTHFQATAARFAFPCYDEPGFKATFDVTIRRPVGFRSWFCTRQVTTNPSPVLNYEDDVYSTTPIMSTYLLALIVAEYESQELIQNGNLTYEVIGRPAAILDNQGDYAFSLGQRLLAEMSSHTDMDFYSVHPNLKMTQAAIPDFNAGAMENWGLLVYREAYIMYSPEHTNGYFQQLIAYILSHEIAHMWFGNLVTCDWWDNLWLNEGFARYYQYFLTDWVEESLGLGIRFIPEQVHTALLTDSAGGAHPLTNPGLGSPVEVRTMFTQISYNKGAAVIRMTEHLMGSENHREGLRRYLRNRQFNTALPIHLFQALQETAVETGATSEYGSDFNIIEYYRTWSEQSGHPVLFVNVNHQTGEMTIYQRRFDINRGYSVPNTNWIIPITFATASNPDFEDTKPTHILRDSITVINRTSVGDEWVIFNKQQTGFFRVFYDDYTWDLITMFLRGDGRETVHEFNRAQIVNDVFQFARSGLMSYTRAFNILSFLSEETCYTPWAAAITGFNWINNRFINTPLEAEFNTLFRQWASTVMTNLTYYPTDGEPFMRSYLRYQLAPVMCRLQDPQCLEAASQQFLALRNNGQEVPVDSRSWVYCNGLRYGTYEDFEFLWNRFLNHNVYSEKIQLLMVLGCTSNENALNVFLDAIVEDNYIIRRQDYTTAFNSAATGNEANTQIVFNYIRNNLNSVSNAPGSLTTALSYVSSRLRTPEQVAEFQEWANNTQEELGPSFVSIYNAASTTLNALQWASTVQEDINNYIENGNTDVQFSTSAPVVTTPAAVFTVAPILEAATPDLPGSASISILSSLSIIVGLLAYATA